MPDRVVEADKTIGVLFPGQGAQYVGMGRELAGKFPTADKVFRQSDEALGFDISSLIFNGPAEQLTLTKNSQPAIYIVSWAAFRVLKERLPAFDARYFAGLSLGEYTAYAAAGAFAYEDGLRLVRKRGELMQQCAEDHPGTMASVLGLAPDAIKGICEEVNRDHPVNVANINSAEQIVISGSIEGVRDASVKCSEAGAKRVIPLKVSGAFHSSLMKEAADGLAEYLEGVSISLPETSVISNVLGREAGGIDEMRKTLADQVTHPVRWHESMRHLVANCVNVFVECGCGKVLRGLLRRTAPDALAVGVEDADSLDETVTTLSGIL